MDENQIEEYLRSFRPLSPAPFPQRRRQWSFIALGTAAALLIGILLRQSPPVPAELSEQQPITIGSANQLLARSSSWKEVIEDSGFAFRTLRTGDAPLSGSALELLSQQELSK
jgi:hypothetical protein